MSTVKEQKPPSAEVWLIVVGDGEVPAFFEIAQQMGLTSPTRIQPDNGGVRHRNHITPISTGEFAFRLTFPSQQSASNFHRLFAHRLASANSFN